MHKFRLPRKTKKALKKTMFVYLPDKDESSLMAFPARFQKDYDALKNGTAKKFPYRTKAERKKYIDLLDKEIFVDDQVLKTYVNAIFRIEWCNSTYNTLIEAKNNPRAIKAYFNFINAYQMVEKGKDSYGNICCMAVDNAKELLKAKKNK